MMVYSFQAFLLINIGGKAKETSLIVKKIDICMRFRVRIEMIVSYITSYKGEEF